MTKLNKKKIDKIDLLVFRVIRCKMLLIKVNFIKYSYNTLKIWKRSWEREKHLVNYKILKVLRLELIK
jgi:hypothetical protein